MSAKRKSTKRNNNTTRNVCIVAAALAVITLGYYTFEGEHTAPTPTAILSPLAENDIRVHFIDLGQADGILLQSGENAVLIDGGEYKTRDSLVNYLRGAGITSLDYVVATHPHSDHIGGLAAVIRQFDVKNILMPDATNNTATFDSLLAAIEDKGLSVTVPSVGDKITAGIIELTVLAPAGKDFKDLNNASIVLRMAHGDIAFLFTGDAETPSETEMLNGGLNLRADVLKAGHHGSRTATSAQFLDAVRPATVVVTCGRQNSYGHPHKEFLEIVNQPERNITLLRTDESGTIIMTTDGKDIRLYIIGEGGDEPSAG
jgi:beta-lactamase superfamily II metal-dependent hydrolase